jgi:hypothetical protein
MKIAPAVAIIAAPLLATGVRAQQEPEQRNFASTEEPAFVLEVGPAAEWPLRGERANYGGNIGIEREVIEDWLELEAGLTGLATSARGELSEDLLFKKPFRLSPDLEFFIGVGPELAHTFTGSDKGTSTSVEFAAELMYLPSSGIGWYVEPAFSVEPVSGKKAFGVTGGVAIGF